MEGALSINLLFAYRERLSLECHFMADNRLQQAVEGEQAAKEFHEGNTCSPA